MEFSIVKFFVLAAWFFCGIALLDKMNSNPAKWNRGDTGGASREFLTLFFGPVFFLLSQQDSSFVNSLKNLFNRGKRTIKYRDITIIDSHGAPMYGTDCDNPAIDKLKDVIILAVAKRASDIFLDPAGERMQLRFRADGSLINIENFTADFGDNVVNAIKVAAGMDITEKRRPQDGSFAAECSGSSVAFRVATVGAFGGEKVAIRLLGSEVGSKTLEDIGFNPEQLHLLKNAVGLSSGMILMCGATGSGKTTTLYALINNIDFSLKNVISIEDPVERVIPHVSQMEVNAKADITFAKLLRNALRQNPDVICLGEIRDEETAQIAVHAAQTGHLIISTVHSNDSVDTLDRLSNLGIPFRSLAATLKVIVNQRLVRRLCEHCRQPLTEIPDRWKEYFSYCRFPADHIYAPCGCPECNGTGYKGRAACFDILVIDASLRAELEKENTSLSQIKTIAEARNAANSLTYHAAYLAASGVTSFEEIDRVTLALDGGIQ